MTGFFVRVARDGKYDHFEIDELTDEELEAFASRLPRDKGASWLVALAKWIRENVHADPPAGGVRACRKCGCTDARACPGGCWWVEYDLCSACD
jgi:hypothetical protein